MPQGLLADVGNVSGKLFTTELRLTDLDVKLVDVDRGVNVLLDQSLGDNDRVFEVVSFPRHEGDQHVAAQGQLAILDRRRITHHPVDLDPCRIDIVDTSGLLGLHHHSRPLGNF